MTIEGFIATFSCVTFWMDFSFYSKLPHFLHVTSKLIAKHCSVFFADFCFWFLRNNAHKKLSVS